MYSKISFVLLTFSLLFTACNKEAYVNENSAFIMFKTSTFKYADMGFIYENSSEVKAEIYGSGQALMSLSVNSSSVCLSLIECMSKKEFNKQVLSSSYPDNILDNIFRGKAIFSSKNIVKNSRGFTQTIVKPNKYNIKYSVLNNEIVFNDKINQIVIKVKKF
ncbi:FIG00545237: hypothetical protein [hydrothermal vent metagenome]|uniref:Lipoprotein n=1 Tax=hydrothermal vent metagenome TaxID=652676 RepID=A0A1W1EBV9_9ZZZZ